MTVVAAAVCASILFAAGCAREKRGAAAAAEYARLAREAVALYIDVEPLRSSRLGLTASDSLLFTYSDDEISRALGRLKGLEARFAKLSVADLPAADADNAEIIAYWCRGEIFALEEMRSYRYNPLLYCWAAEEALWGIPSRIDAPAPGELDAYRARIARVSALLANARRHLDNPAEAHTRYAVERLASIDSSFAELSATVLERYGDGSGKELERTRRSIEAFRLFASDTLLERSRGRLILGAEYLSKIFLYGELMNADPNMIASRAETSMRKIVSERSSLSRKMAFLGRERPPGGRARGDAAAVAPSPSSAAPAGPARRANEPFEETVKRLLRRLVPDSLASYAAPGAARLAIAYPVRTGSHSAIPASLSLTVPPAEHPPVEVSLSRPLDALRFRPACFLSARAARLDAAGLLAPLLRAAPAALEMDSLLSASRDTIRTVFASETFREGWFYVAMRGRTAGLRAADPRLAAAMQREEVLALARTVVVFRLHAGSMTSDGAASYLVQAAELSPDDAAREVLAASVSPSIAYRGIAMVLIDGLSETMSYMDGLEKEERSIESLLRANPGLPLPIIEDKLHKN